MSVGAPGDGRTVLVVEDDHEIAELVRLYLVRDGYRVRIEHRGDTGLAAARSLRPAACVLDIALPGMDGVEVCRRLREAGDWTPIIFLTARDDEVDRVLGLELGADDYVTKPFSPRELVARVRAVLRRRTSRRFAAWGRWSSTRGGDGSRSTAGRSASPVRSSRCWSTS